MSWRIYLWIVGVIVLMTRAPSFTEPSHPNVIAAREAFRDQPLAAVLGPLSPAKRGLGLLPQVRSPQS